MKCVVASVVCLILGGCSSAKECPDNYRSHHINFVPKDEGDYLVKVDDCLIEYTGKVANGSASDGDIAKAAIGYCGTYDYPVGLGPLDKDNMEREIRTALNYVVTQRAYHCPAPSERDITTGRLRANGWIPAFLQNT